METITLTREGLKKIISRTSGMTAKYKDEVVEALFRANKNILDGNVRELLEDKSNK